MAEYVELEMRIGQEEATLRVDDEEPYVGPTDFSPETLERLEDLRLSGSSAEGLGKALFLATFQGDTLKAWKDLAQHRSVKRYRLRLNIDAALPQLHRLWWESLCDPGPPLRPLGRERWIPLSRSLLQTPPREPLKVKKLRVLVAVSNPVDLGQQGGEWAQYPRLSDEEEDEERAVITGVLEELNDRVEYDFQDSPASVHQIRRRLYHDGFHVLHLVARGGTDGEKSFLLLERDEDEKADPADDEDLGFMVDGLDNLQLVVLAASFGAERPGVDVFGGLVPRIVEYEVPAVIAMQQQMEKDVAPLFTRAFYEALLKSRETQGLLDAAVNAARDELFSRLRKQAPWAWTIPVLFMHGQGKLVEPLAVAQRPGGAARAAQMAPEPTLAPGAAARRETVISTAAGPPAFEQPPSDAPNFSQSTIFNLLDLLLQAGFADPDRQENLFGGINTAFVADLPDKGAPRDRLLTVLNRLNKTRRLATGEEPFYTFLYNAVKISCLLPQSAELDRYLKRLREPVSGPSKAGPGSGYGGKAHPVADQPDWPKTGGYGSDDAASIKIRT
jgi:hypothetical protein